MLKKLYEVLSGYVREVKYTYNHSIDYESKQALKRTPMGSNKGLTLWFANPISIILLHKRKRVSIKLKRPGGNHKML